MFNKSIIKLFVKLIGGLAGVGIILVIMANATSKPTESVNDNSVANATTDSVDAGTDFDSDFDSDFDTDFDADFDSDFDSDFDNESDDFDESTNSYSPLPEDLSDAINFKEYKNAFDLEFDLSDAERDIRKKHPEDSYRLKNFIIDKNEKTASGYNAIVRVDLEGYDTVLRQEVTLSYDLDETFNNWDYKGYELTGEETIYSDLEYSSVEQENIPFEKKGTFVYEAINRDMADNSQYRKLYVYYVAQGTAMGYETSASCIVLVNKRIVSVDTINETGDTSLHPRYPVSYDLSDNGLRRDSDNWLVFTYNENGGVSEDRQYVRISDEILEPEEIADMWVNGK